MAILINENIEVLTVTVQHHIIAAQKTIREALSTPPSKADADDVERVAKALHEGLSKQDVIAYLDGNFDCHWLARHVLSAIQSRDAGLREPTPAEFKTACKVARDAMRLQGFSGGWDNEALVRAIVAALQMGGENHDNR